MTWINLSNGIKLHFNLLSSHNKSTVKVLSPVFTITNIKIIDNQDNRHQHLLPTSRPL